MLVVLLAVPLAPGPLWAQGSPSEVIEGEYLVKFKPAAFGQVLGKLRGKAQLKGSFAQKGMYHLSNTDASLLEELRADPDVLYVEPNYRLQTITGDAQGQAVSAEEIQSTQSYTQSGAPVKAVEAWARSAAYDANNRPIVAIIDTGLDSNHYVFRQTNSLWVNTREIPGNGIDDDFNGYVDDVSGWNFITNSPNFFDDEDHGTHVAGIVLGATQNILAPQADLEPAKVRLMPLKFLDANGSGSTSAAISAMYYAVNMGAKVINCSWGGGSYSRALHDAITYAYEHGVIVVTAAGNYSNNNDVTPMYPANYDVPSNLSVAATGDSDRLASFSNYGASKVQIGAPGVYVYSTLPGGYFLSLSGTSMAAPFVAGAAAMAAREAPNMSGYQLRSMMIGTADAVSYLSGKVSSSGRVNLNNLLGVAQGQVSTSSYQPAYKPDYSADRSPASDAGAPAGCGLVSSVAGAGWGLGGGGSGGGGMAPGTVTGILFLLPFLLWVALRLRSPKDQRRFDRYIMQSDLIIKSGDRQLVGTIKTISMGGLSFDVDEALERGGTIQMKVLGPDGREAIEVEGRIVWSEQNQSYGVQFSSVREQAKAVLFGWTRHLVRQE
ncbi:MAG: S8 family serine peptidase [Bdellovibrionaceae bacterium]|nr:S8 family serine peptidase [Pseudobdellovibrionaceae bacterium]